VKAGWIAAALLVWATALRGEAPPLKMNLDEFDALKKVVLLPNGEHLGYIDMGNPKGVPVVLIHGYTDNARDWEAGVLLRTYRFRL
jgi:pimeloyl-ACP methyl ester carboxylesterase